MAAGGQATSFGSNTATETTTQNSNNTDASRSTTSTDYGSVGNNSARGADLSLAESSGNVFNLADPTLTLAAAGIAQSGLADAFHGLERITDTSGLAVRNALDLAGKVQGGQGEQIASTVKSTAWALFGVTAAALVLYFLFRKKG